MWGAAIGAAPGFFGIGLTLVLRHRDHKGEREKAAIADVTAWTREYETRSPSGTVWRNHELNVENRGPAIARNVSVTIDADKPVRTLTDLPKNLPSLDIGQKYPIGFTVVFGGPEEMTVKLSWEDGRKGVQHKELTMRAF